MEGKNEKDIKFLAICFIIIQSIVIGFVAFFVVGIARVDAADYQDLTPNSINLNSVLTNGNVSNTINCQSSDLTSCYLNFNTSSNQSFKIDFNASYYASASNQIQFQYTLGLRMGNEHLQTFLNWNNVQVKYLDSSGNTIKDISGSCTTTGSSWGHDYYESGFPMREEQWTLTTTCNEINPGGNANKIEIITPFPTGVSFIRQFYFYSKSLTLKRIVGTITDTERLENSLNSNTQNIINNQNNNTQNIINNQNENAEKIEDAINNQNIKCINYNYNKNQNRGELNKYLSINNTYTSATNWAVSNYTKVNKGKTYVINVSGTYINPSYCLYNKDKTLLNCAIYNSNETINVTPNEDGYIRYSFTYSENRNPSFTGEYCYNIIEQGQEDIADSINDPSIDTSGLSGFSVTGNDGGISSIITAPLSAITGILNSTCTDIIIPIPFVSDKNITLPCLTPIYQQHFPQILSIWQVVVTGIIAYWICLNIFHMVHGFTDPNDDKIEVVDL